MGSDRRDEGLQPGRGPWSRRLLALVLGSLCALVVAEVGYRWSRGAALGPTTNPAYVVHDAELGFQRGEGVRRHLRSRT